MPIDQSVFFHTGFDPVAFKKIKTLDIIYIQIIQKLMGMSGRFNRHTIAGQRIKMWGLRKSITGGFYSIERGLYQRPFPRSAFDPLFSKGDIFVPGKRSANVFIVLQTGICIKMDGYIIPAAVSCWAWSIMACGFLWHNNIKAIFANYILPIFKKHYNEIQFSAHLPHYYLIFL